MTITAIEDEPHPYVIVTTQSGTIPTWVSTTAVEVIHFNFDDFLNSDSDAEALIRQIDDMILRLEMAPNTGPIGQKKRNLLGFLRTYREWTIEAESDVREWDGNPPEE